eukprot:scaffold7186_cov83-Cylindrotheca_fusiformis.AAC.3
MTINQKSNSCADKVPRKGGGIYNNRERAPTTRSHATGSTHGYVVSYEAYITTEEEPRQQDRTLWEVVAISSTSDSYVDANWHRSPCQAVGSEKYFTTTRRIERGKNETLASPNSAVSVPIRIAYKLSEGIKMCFSTATSPLCFITPHHTTSPVTSSNSQQLTWVPRLIRLH